MFQSKVPCHLTCAFRRLTEHSPLATFIVYFSFCPFIGYILICLKIALKNGKRPSFSQEQQQKSPLLSFFFLSLSFFFLPSFLPSFLPFFFFLFVLGFCFCCLFCIYVLELTLDQGGLQLRHLPTSAPECWV